MTPLQYKKENSKIMQTDFSENVKTLITQKSVTTLTKILSTLPPDSHHQLIKEYLAAATTIPNHYLDTLVEKLNADSALLLIDKIILLKKELFYMQLIFEKIKLSPIQIRSILERENSHAYVISVLNESMLPIILNLLLNENDTVVLRNCCAIAIEMVNRFKTGFNHERLLSMLDSEHVFMRTTYLDILHVLDPTNLKIFEQRLLDVHYIVRLKALSLIFSCISTRPVDNLIIQLSIDRILDKTVMVRKKALSMINSINDEKIILYAISKIEFLVQTDCRAEVAEICAALQHIYRQKIDVSHIYITLLSRSTAQDVIECAVASISTFSNNISFLISIKPVISIVVKELGRRRYFKREWFDRIFDIIKTEEVESNEMDVLIEGEIKSTPIKKIDKNNAMLLLSLIIKYIEVENEKIIELVKFVSNLFFNSKNEEELSGRIIMYRHMLMLLSAMKDKTVLIDILIKNYVKMNFFDPIIGMSMLRLTISRDYDSRIKTFLKFLCTKNTNRLKITAIVGDIAIEQAKIIDVLESRTRKVKSNLPVSEELKERRRSINASRMSLRNSVEIDVEKMIHKSEDEIADILFYVKEREILYSKNSLVAPFVNLVLDGCSSDDQNILITSYNSILKFMSISSEFFERNFLVFENGLRHTNSIVRCNCIVMMRDYFVSYNFILEKKADILFDALFDAEAHVRRHAVLIIYDLIYKNILRPRNNSHKLAMLVVDGDEKIRVMGASLFSRVKNESVLSSVLYETLTRLNDIENILKSILPVMNDKIKESCFVKLLRYKEKKNNCKVFYQMAGFSEKFVKEMEMFEEFNDIVKVE